MTTPQAPPVPIYEYTSKRRQTESGDLTPEDEEMARIVLTANSEEESAGNAFEQADQLSPEDQQVAEASLPPFPRPQALGDNEADHSILGLEPNNDDGYYNSIVESVGENPPEAGFGTQKANLPRNVATVWGHGVNPTVSDSADLANRYYSGQDIAEGADFAEIAEEEANSAIEEGATNTDVEDRSDDMMAAANVDNYALDTFEDGLEEEEMDLLAGSDKIPQLPFVDKLNQAGAKRRNKYKYTPRRGKSPLREPNKSGVDKLFDRLRERNEGIREQTRQSREGAERPGEATAAAGAAAGATAAGAAGAAAAATVAAAPAPNNDPDDVPTVTTDPVGTPPAVDPTTGLTIPGTGNQRSAPPDEDDEDDLKGFGRDDEDDEDEDDDDDERESARESARDPQRRGSLNLDDIPEEDGSRVRENLGIDADDYGGTPGARSVKDILGTRRGRDRRRRRKEKKGRGRFGA